MHFQRLGQRLLRRNTHCKSGSPKCSNEVLFELEEGFEKLSNCPSKSLLKKHLTLPIFDKLKRKVTPKFKSTLLDCIRVGLYEPDAPIGICAPDPEAYTTFADIFNPIIEDYHQGFKATDIQPDCCFGYGTDFPNLDPQGRFILSTRVRCSRSLSNYPFSPRLSEGDYVGLEQMVRTSLCTLCNEHSGEYHKLCDMKQPVRRKLTRAKLLFVKGNKFVRAAKGVCHWPIGRGVFLNKQNTFVVWVNEEDHIRVISIQKGGNLGQVYERLIIGIESLRSSLQFWQDKRLGHLNFCPTNVGTSLRASVHIRLPHLGEDPVHLVKEAAKLELKVCGTDCEDSIYEISNRRCLGLTEYQIITDVYNGLRALIDIECQLSMKK